MSDLIPDINFADFVKIIEHGKLEELQSSQIIFNDKHIFTAIIPHGDAFATSYARTQAEYLALRTNSVSGKTPAELMAEIEEEICRFTSSNVKKDAGVLKSAENTTKPRKSGVRRAKAKRKGSGRRSTGASVGSMTPMPT